MKILWISFIGSWTIPLLEALNLKGNNRYGLIIPTTDKKQKTHINISNVDIYTINLKPHDLYYNMSPSIFRKYNKYILEFAPDIIHIHGTEKNLAQIQNYIHNIPIVISIQGLLTGYKNYAFNYIHPTDIKNYSTLKNKIGKGGYNLMYKYFCRGISYETDILKKGKYFIGRTYWDKSHIMFHNPNALYFHGEELLRKEFYLQAATWDVSKCKRYSIFMPSGFNPIKGMHLAITTVALLKQYYPNISLSIPGISPNDLKRFTSKFLGEEYIIYCKNLIQKFKLNDNIRFLPRLDAKGMVNEMQNAHVFLSPSSIDNSPNAVGEATMIGTPIVITPVGGIPSILQDEKEVLFAPAGDPYMMAFQIKRIFENDELAISLSKNAHLKALKRHDREKTASLYLRIYQEIIKIHHA